MTESELIKSVADALIEEPDILKAKLMDRTTALREAVGMAQDHSLPSLEMVNRWRAALGWHKREKL